MPNVRMVLLKGFDERGFVFYTNLESQKGQELLGHAQGGPVLPLEIAAPPGAGARAGRGGDRAPRPTPISQSRPRDSRIGAWASKQSRPLESRFALETAVAMYAARYAIGEVPRPPTGRASG